MHTCLTSEPKVYRMGYTHDGLPLNSENLNLSTLPAYHDLSKTLAIYRLDSKYIEYRTSLPVCDIRVDTIKQLLQLNVTSRSCFWAVRNIDTAIFQTFKTNIFREFHSPRRQDRFNSRKTWNTSKFFERKTAR